MAQNRLGLICSRLFGLIKSQMPSFSDVFGGKGGSEFPDKQKPQ